MAYSRVFSCRNRQPLHVYKWYPQYRQFRQTFHESLLEKDAKTILRYMSSDYLQKLAVTECFP